CQKIDNDDDISIKYIPYIFYLFYYMEKKIKEDHHQEQQKEEPNSTKNTETTTTSSTHMMNLITTSDHHQMELAGNNMNLSSIFDIPISSPFAYSYFEDHSSNNPYSFLDLLRQDQHQFASSSNSSSFSFNAFPLQNNTNHIFTYLPLSQPVTTKDESSEVVSTTPTSPNSTSFSSSSNEAANDNINKELKTKKMEINMGQRPRYLLSQHHQPYNIMYNNSLSMINRSSSSDGSFVNPGSSSFHGFGCDMSQASTSTTSTIRDHGLLQDILPSQIRSDTINTRTNEEDNK
ncbi:LOW QUALITY PROTEIN: hypothetical protein HID58_049444, partial [Brassica napus]